jgi:hypothetical protein
VEKATFTKKIPREIAGLFFSYNPAYGLAQTAALSER